MCCPGYMVGTLPTVPVCIRALSSQVGFADNSLASTWNRMNNVNMLPVTDSCHCEIISYCAKLWTEPKRGLGISLAEKFPHIRWPLVHLSFGVRCGPSCDNSAPLPGKLLKSGPMLILSGFPDIVLFSTALGLSEILKGTEGGKHGDGGKLWIRILMGH